MIAKRPIFFPSFSTGEFANECKQNKILGGKVPVRFYSKDFPEEYRHPYFLITAGHLYKKKDFRAQLGLEDAFVMGDSGGYQIAMGAIKWDMNIRHEIFEWLENNSDLAMNIDIPPYGDMAGKFDQCLTISVDNFKYFADKQTGKTKFLNVLQGNNYKQRLKWYNAVKDFEFSGWSLGGCRIPYRFCAAITALVQGKEHLNPRNEYIHILGTTKINDFFYLSQLQKSLSEVGSNMTVTTDSSSPSRSVAFGLYYIGANLNIDSFKSIHIPKANSANKKFVVPECIQTILPHQYDMPMPVVTEFDKLLSPLYTYGDCVNNVNDSTMYMSMHNFMLYQDVMKTVSNYVNHHDYLLSQVSSATTRKVMKIIDEIVKSDDPEKILHANESYLVSLSTVVNRSNSTESVHNEFFDIK
jgi:hypothetical protein